jgi:trans-aconitate 2-methyltransferase
VQSLDLWETEYQQILEGENPVPEYVKGSWLKPFLDALEEPEKSTFEAEYKKNVLVHYPPQSDGKTLFPFRRLFIIARV